MAENRTKLSAALGAACLIICLFCGISLICRKAGLRLSGKTYEKVRGEAVHTDREDLSAIDTEHLLEMNPDYVFWLVIPGTEISYPVVQTQNNSDYLRTSFTGKPCIGGCIFVDASCPADLSGFNTVIYGHRMPDGTMFTGLAGYLSGDFAREHGELRIYMEKGTRIYRLCAVLRTDARGDYARTAFADGETFLEWLEEQKSMALYDAGLDTKTHAVTLVTCAGNGSERLAVIWLPEE